MTTQPTAITQAQSTNTRTFDSLMADAVTLGKQAGEGKDTQIKFYLKVFEAAYHGTIDLTPAKHGADVDDAAKLTEAYVKAQGSATVFDAKAGNQRKAASCVRACITGGSWTKGGAGEPLATANNLMNIRQGLRKDPANVKKLDDAANTLLKLCRVLKKSDQLPADSMLRSFCFKSEHRDLTNDELVLNIRRLAQALLDGKGGTGKVLDMSQQMRDVVQACNKRLTQIAKDKAAAKAA